MGRGTVVRRLTGLVLSLAVVGLGLMPVTAAAQEGGAAVQVWLTDINQSTYLARQGDITLSRGQAPDGTVLAVDSNRQYQQITGFGASFTDSSAWLASRLDPVRREALLQELFSSQNGIGLSMLRQPMGASDFAVAGNYSYDDMPAGQTDPALQHFSIGHDEAYIIPVLRQALEVNPALTIMANPWSPPGWMKTTGSMIGGTLRADAYEPLAEYFVKFIEAYAAQGVPIRYITPQNEPLYRPTGYPGMGLSATQERDLVEQYLGPALGAHHLPTQILAYDHNWDVPSYPETLYADPAAAAFVAGTAWHCYGGEVGAQAAVHNDYPNQSAFHTECSGGTWQGGDRAAFDAEMKLLIESTRDWGRSVILWNMALDEHNGPTNGGCMTCRGVVTVSRGAGGTWSYQNTIDYYALGQLSRFVRPGARRIASTSLGQGSVEDVAFINPDGSTALTAYNPGQSRATFAVQWGSRWFTSTLNPGAAATFTWRGKQDGTTQGLAGSVDLRFANPAGPQAVVSYDASLLRYENQVRSGSNWFGYTVPAGATLDPATSEQLLPRQGWVATASSSSPWDPPAQAIDGNLATRWSSGHGQTPGDWFQVDLGSVQPFNQLTVDSGASNGDFAHGYQVFVSDDGATWGQPIASGPGTSQLLKVVFPTVRARFIRLVNTGKAGNWWSIAELNVFAPQGPAGGQTETGTVERRTAELPDGTRLLGIYNPGPGRATFSGSWGETPFRYSLPVAAAVLFTRRPG